MDSEKKLKCRQQFLDFLKNNNKIRVCREGKWVKEDVSQKESDQVAKLSMNLYSETCLFAGQGIQTGF